MVSHGILAIWEASNSSIYPVNAFTHIIICTDYKDLHFLFPKGQLALALKQS